jgi:hypothetical protein
MEFVTSKNGIYSKHFFPNFLLLILSFLISIDLKAQQQEKSEQSKVELTLEGMAGVSFGEKFVAFNVGGPNLLLNIGKNWRTGLGAFPSFYVRNGKTGARLGVGGRVDYKNMVLFSSFYHFERLDIWVGSVGLGYKFHKKK